MQTRNLKRITPLTLFVILLASNVEAKFINWVDWTDEAATTVSGIGKDGDVDIAVEYAGIHHQLVTSTNGAGIEYWAFDNGSVYTNNAVVDNGPPDSDIVGLIGGAGALNHRVTFSQAVLNPVMAILSLGRPNSTITYDFGDEAFTILSSGRGHWGGAAGGSLFEVTESILTGTEGHGVIQFEGSYSEISWSVPINENWHGFTFGFEGVAPVPVPAAIWGFFSAIFLLNRRLGFRHSATA